MPTAKKTAKAKTKVQFHDLKAKKNPKGGALVVTTPKLADPVIKITTSSPTPTSSSSGGAAHGGWDLSQNTVS